MKSRTTLRHQSEADRAKGRETAQRIFEFVSRGLFDEADALFARSGFATALSAPGSAQALFAGLSIRREQASILAALGRYYAGRENEPLRLAVLGELELLSARPVKALEALNASLRMAPGNIGTHLMLAKALLTLRQPNDASANLERALSLAPDNAEVQTEVGQIYSQFNAEQAIRCFQIAISKNNRNFTAVFGLANALKLVSRLREAVDVYSIALSINPRHVEALNNRGASLQVLDRDEEAVRDFEAATKIDRRHLFAWLNKGVSLYKLDRYEESLEAIEIAFAINPGMPDVFHNCGLTLMKLNRHDEAIFCFESATLMAPERLQGLLSKGNALVELHRYEDAVDIFRSAVEKDRNFTDAYINMAGALQEMGRHCDAIDIMTKALEVNPGYSEAYWNKANSMLAFGPSEDAWKAYEHRLHISVGEPLPDFGLPLLGEQAPDGKRMLVQWEQRFGDVIQMLRFVPAMNSASDCYWQVSDSMIDMVRASFPEMKVCGLNDCPAGLDTRTPYTSLPLNLKVFSVEQIPSKIPYLRPSDAAVEKWGVRAKTLARRIGIVWRGNPKPPGRTVPVDKITPMLEKFAGDLVSLQMEVTPEEAAILERFSIPDLGSELKTFDDSAGLLCNLDLVITIDTAVAHLAGALGCETWILLKYGSDWRWMLDRRDSPWYPTAKLHRQPSVGDWQSAIDQVSADLGAFLQA
jgi:tetratricopeptide (TPR) repeat protein